MRATCKVISVAMLVFTTFSLCTQSVAETLDLVVITARKNLSATLCDSEGNCVYASAVLGLTEPAGMGSLPRVDIEVLKRLIDAIELPCKSPSQSTEDYVRGATALCVGKAAANYSAIYGAAVGGLAAIAAQSSCNVKVADALQGACS